MILNLSLNEFLSQLEEGKFRPLEIHNYIGSVTDNFDAKKLSILLEDIKYVIPYREDACRKEWEERLPSLRKAGYNENGEPNPALRKIKGKVHDMREEVDFIIRAQLDDFYIFKQMIEEELEQAIEQKAESKIKLGKSDISKKRAKRNFSYYLNEDGQKLLPRLHRIYDNGPKTHFVIMLRALNRLGVLINYSFKSGHSEINDAMKAEFSGVGTRQLLEKYIDIFENPIGSDKQELEYQIRNISNPSQESKE